MVFFRWNHRRNESVSDSISDSTGDSATSLYGYLSLNLSVIPSVKSSDVTTPLHISRQTVYPVGKMVHWYIQTDFEMELFTSVIITDRKSLSVIPLIFSGFLVVILARN